MKLISRFIADAYIIGTVSFPSKPKGVRKLFTYPVSRLLSSAEAKQNSYFDCSNLSCNGRRAHTSNSKLFDVISGPNCTITR